MRDLAEAFTGSSEMNGKIGKGGLDYRESDRNFHKSDRNFDARDFVDRNCDLIFGI